MTYIALGIPGFLIIHLFDSVSGIWHIPAGNTNATAKQKECGYLYKLPTAGKSQIIKIKEV